MSEQEFYEMVEKDLEGQFKDPDQMERYIEDNLEHLAEVYGYE